jgi:Galactoside-binding lectin
MTNCPVNHPNVNALCFERFHVNLQQGRLTYPHPSIALHVNPRSFCAPREMILNSCFGHWSVEEKTVNRRKFEEKASSLTRLLK